MNTPVIRCAVKEFRQKNGWSQEELANRVDIRRQSVYDMESGKYLPNTAVALRLARVFGCAVEDLFVEQPCVAGEKVRVIGEDSGGMRLAIARVRDGLVGFPLSAGRAMPFSLRPADGVLPGQGAPPRLLASPEELEKSLLVLGCDPALDILADYMRRILPSVRMHSLFASSAKALSLLREGAAHVAATHFHNAGPSEANVAAVREKLPGMPCRVLGFSFMEEGLMVARGNPLGIRNAPDVIRPGLRFINREPGAALRKLFEGILRHAGFLLPGEEGSPVAASHAEGASHVACGAADAALGLRVVAEAFGLSFIPLAATRCDLVIPIDLEHSPAVAALLDSISSARLRREIASLPGHDSVYTGKEIALVTAPPA